jgi:membrane fusion protein (multidrug efflux system)
MRKKIILVGLGLLLLVLSLAGMKVLQIRAMISQGESFVPPPTPVTSTAAAAETWTEALSSVGTLSAVQGVTVAAEVPGKVARISFEPGAWVDKGALLVRLDTSTEEAQLPGALATSELARLNRERADRMKVERIISQADHDGSMAAEEQALAQANQIRAAIAKKTIRAPFSGRLGVRKVNLGQILREGDPIVTLQSMDPIFVDFTVPQQELGRVKYGQMVTITCDALPGQTIQGRITAVSPLVDPETRNIMVQATVRNVSESLRPGMFVNAAVDLAQRREVLAIPATAVLYAPYSDSVFVIETGKDGKGLAARQQLVRLGAKRGDWVEVANGLKAGDTVVSTGVFKLRNGQPVVVDNTLAPDFQQAPAPENN